MSDVVPHLHFMMSADGSVERSAAARTRSEYDERVSAAMKRLAGAVGGAGAAAERFGVHIGEAERAAWRIGTEMSAVGRGISSINRSFAGLTARSIAANGVWPDDFDVPDNPAWEYR